MVCNGRSNSCVVYIGRSNFCGVYGGRSNSFVVCNGRSNFCGVCNCSVRADLFVELLYLCPFVPLNFFYTIIPCKALPHPSSDRHHHLNAGQSSKKKMEFFPIAPEVVKATDLNDQVVSGRDTPSMLMGSVESAAPAVTFEEAAVTSEEFEIPAELELDEAIFENSEEFDFSEAEDEPSVTDAASISGSKRARDELVALEADREKRARVESDSDSDSDSAGSDFDSDAGSDAGSDSDSAAAPTLAGASASDIMSMLTPEQLAAITAQLGGKSDGIKSNMGTAKKYRRPKKLDVIHNNFVRANKHLPKFKKSGNYLLPEASIKWLPKWANDNLEKISDFHKQSVAASAGKGVKIADISDDDISIDEHEDFVVELEAQLARYHKAMEEANTARIRISLIIGEWGEVCKNL